MQELTKPEFVGPVLSMLLIAFVILVWPLSRKSAELLQMIIEERRRGDNAKQLSDMAATLDRIEDHLQQLEERQSFTESLVSRTQPAAISANGTAPDRPRAALAGD
jgi:Mg2+ and Co2+ transporter CorA